MIERELYMKQIRPFMDKDIVKVLTGIRRSGKSVLLQLIKRELLKQGVSEENIIELNFESNFLPFRKEVTAVCEYFENLFKGSTTKKYVLLDKIQDLTDWEKMINAFMIDYHVDIYITGSNAKL